MLVSVNYKNITIILAASLIVAITIPSVSALSGTWTWSGFCGEMDIDGKTTAGDFICDADIYDMRNKILQLKQEVPIVDNKVNVLQQNVTDIQNDMSLLQQIQSDIIINNTAVAATGTITMDDIPNGNMVVVNGFRDYARLTETNSNFEFLMTGTDAEDAAGLAADLNSWSRYGVTAIANGNIITLTARELGTEGNSITLYSGGRGSTVSGPTLTGGVDAMVKVADQADMNRIAIEELQSLHSP